MLKNSIFFLKELRLQQVLGEKGDVEEQMGWGQESCVQSPPRPQQGLLSPTGG